MPGVSRYWHWPASGVGLPGRLGQEVDTLSAETLARFERALPRALGVAVELLTSSNLLWGRLASTGACIE